MYGSLVIYENFSLVKNMWVFSYLCLIKMVFDCHLLYFISEE